MAGQLGATTAKAAKASGPLRGLQPDMTHSRGQAEYQDRVGSSSPRAQNTPRPAPFSVPLVIAAPSSTNLKSQWQARFLESAKCANWAAPLTARKATQAVCGTSVTARWQFWEAGICENATTDSLAAVYVDNLPISGAVQPTACLLDARPPGIIKGRFPYVASLVQRTTPPVL